MGTHISFHYSARRKMLSKPVSQANNDQTRVLPAALAGELTIHFAGGSNDPKTKDIQIGDDKTFGDLFTNTDFTTWWTTQAGLETALKDKIANAGSATEIALDKIGTLWGSGEAGSVKMVDKLADQGSFYFLIDGTDKIYLVRKFSTFQRILIALLIVVILAGAAIGTFIAMGGFSSSNEEAEVAVEEVQEL